MEYSELHQWVQRVLATPDELNEECARAFLEANLNQEGEDAKRCQNLEGVFARGKMPKDELVRLTQRLIDRFHCEDPVTLQQLSDMCHDMTRVQGDIGIKKFRRYMHRMLELMEPHLQRKAEEQEIFIQHSQHLQKVQRLLDTPEILNKESKETFENSNLNPNGTMPEDELARLTKQFIHKYYPATDPDKIQQIADVYKDMTGVQGDIALEAFQRYMHRLLEKLEPDLRKKAEEHDPLNRGRRAPPSAAGLDGPCMQPEERVPSPVHRAPSPETGREGQPVEARLTVHETRTLMEKEGLPVMVYNTCVLARDDLERAFAGVVPKRLVVDPRHKTFSLVDNDEAWDSQFFSGISQDHPRFNLHELMCIQLGESDEEEQRLKYNVSTMPATIFEFATKALYVQFRSPSERVVAMDVFKEIYPECPIFIKEGGVSKRCP